MLENCVLLELARASFLTCENGVGGGWIALWICAVSVILWCILFGVSMVEVVIVLLLLLKARAGCNWDVLDENRMIGRRNGRRRLVTLFVVLACMLRDVKR